MKHLKKITVCLMLLAVLCNNRAVYVNAAENVIMTTNDVAVQIVQNGDAKVTFRFYYSDGNTANLFMVINNSSDKYSMPDPPTSSFSNDRCYATIVLVHLTTGEKVTLRAWCDIYGQTDWY